MAGCLPSHRTCWGAIAPAECGQRSLVTELWPPSGLAAQDQPGLISLRVQTGTLGAVRSHHVRLGLPAPKTSPLFQAWKALC